MQPLDDREAERPLDLAGSANEECETYLPSLADFRQPP